jgi:phosphatidylserine/phosphatidylglycerophosphate/cardiolipin synthase-like enzyme
MNQLLTQTIGSAGFTGENSWRVEQATQAAVVIDAEDYFRAAREAMMKARHRIMLIGWDFDARISLRGERLEPGEPKSVGEFILWLADRKPELEIYLLRWDVGALKTLGRGSTIWTTMKWMWHKRIHTKLDGVHPTGGSHHQKIVVVDDCFAFCGGIDMTSDRWDTRKHADDERGRLKPNGKPHGPWHDATTALEGPVAAALGQLGRERWRRATGEELEAIAGVADCWPSYLKPHFRDVPVAVSRTIPLCAGVEEVREIEQLYLDLIGSAKHFIYAESQYFASRKIAEAIAIRLKEADPPEIVLVNPLSADGWLEPIAMDTARARLFEALRRIDHKQRFRLYHPQTEAGEPIYVHAKIMVVDDQVLRIGSSNMNNRSLGLDTECDVTFDSRRSGSRADEDTIRAIRIGLIAEHLGRDEEEVAARIEAERSMIAAIEGLRGTGRTLVPYEIDNLNAVEKWLADNEVLDPETPNEMFELTATRGLFRRRWFGRHTR